MLSDETLKALIESILFVAPEPVSLDGILKAVEGEEKERVKAQLDALIGAYQHAEHGIQIRPVAGGYKFYTKPEHHEVLREFVKSLKPPIRLSRAALETLAVIAYRQPATVPEIDEIRGVNCGGVIHTLLEKKLIMTAGRKNVVGRPILYRTSREFLVQFGLKDVNELPSLKEFEELARQALGSEMPAPAPETPGAEQASLPYAAETAAATTTPTEVAPPDEMKDAEASAPAPAVAAETTAPIEAPPDEAPQRAPEIETAPAESTSLSSAEQAGEQQESGPPPDDVASD